MLTIASLLVVGNPQVEPAGQEVTHMGRAARLGRRCYGNLSKL